MKVTKVTTSKSETSSSLDLFEGVNLSPKGKEQVREEVGTYLVEQTLAGVSESKSVVQGESIPSLSKGPYRKKKLDELGTARADLVFSGEMLDELSFESTKDGIKIGVFGDRAPVLDGHSNLSGKSKLPQRRIIPDEGQSYKRNIQTEVERIISDAVAEESDFTLQDFEDVTTKAELFAVLREKLGELPRAELSLAVFRNENLVRLLRKAKVLKLLE